MINVDHGYVYTPECTEFIDGIFDVCRMAKDYDYLVVVITNQAGIARGYYSERDFLIYMEWMAEQFLNNHAKIDAVYFCPHHPSEGKGAYLQECDCRKPAPGMILQAQCELNIDLASSVLIGDKASDLQAGKSAGVGSCLLVDSNMLPTRKIIESYLVQPN